MKKILAVVLALFSTPAVAQNYLRDDGIFHSVVEGTTNGQFLVNNGGLLGGASLSAIPLTIGTTSISGGVASRILFDNAGVLGEYTLTGSGTVVAMQNAPTFTGLTTITRNTTAWAPLGTTSLHIKGGDTGEARAEWTAANSDSVAVFGRMNGTFAAPTHLLANDQVAGLVGIGIDTDASTTMQQGGAIGGFAGGAWTASSHPFYWDIFTIPSGSTSFNTVSRFGMSGGLSVGAASDMPTGVISAATGFRVNNAATSGNVLRGNGTNFVSAQLGCADLSTPCITGSSPTITTPVINGLPTGTGVATANTVSTLVARDGSGNFSAGTITASLTGHASLDLALSALGTGVQTALGVNVGSAGAPVLFNGAGGAPLSLTLTNATGLPLGTGVTGTLLAAQEPAHTGDVTNTAGSLALSIGATKVTSAMLNSDVFSTAHSWGGIQTFATPVINGLPTGTGVASAATASTIVARDGSAGITAALGTFSSISDSGNADFGTGIAAGATGTYTFGGGTAAGFGPLLVLKSGAASIGFLTDMNLLTGNLSTDVVLQALSGNGLHFLTNASTTDRLTISSAGVVSVPTATASTSTTTGALTVGGGVGIAGALFTNTINVITMAQTSAAQSGTVCYASGTGLVTYDATLGCLASTIDVKDDWRDISPDEALLKVVAMRPGSFRYKIGMGLPMGVHIGFNAEQMAAVDERLVSRDQEGKLRGVRYQQDSALYAAAIAKLKADNDNLRADIQELKRASIRYGD